LSPAVAPYVVVPVAVTVLDAGASEPTAIVKVTDRSGTVGAPESTTSRSAHVTTEPPTSCVHGASGASTSKPAGTATTSVIRTRPLVIRMSVRSITVSPGSCSSSGRASRSIPGSGSATSTSVLLVSSSSFVSDVAAVTVAVGRAVPGTVASAGTVSRSPSASTSRPRQTTSAPSAAHPVGTCPASSRPSPPRSSRTSTGPVTPTVTTSAVSVTGSPRAGVAGDALSSTAAFAGGGDWV
jgi:hypothetical protein